MISEHTSCTTREEKPGQFPSSSIAGDIAAVMGRTRGSPLTRICSPGTQVPHLNHGLKPIVKHRGPDSLLYFAKAKWHPKEGSVLKAGGDFTPAGLFSICVHMGTGRWAQGGGHTRTPRSVCNAGNRHLQQTVPRMPLWCVETHLERRRAAVRYLLPKVAQDVQVPGSVSHLRHLGGLSERARSGGSGECRKESSSTTPAGEAPLD